MEANNVVQYQPKIQQLLQKFLEPDFEIKNDTYLNRLLTHFSGQDKTEVDTTLINNPIFSEWLVQAILFWESNNTTPAVNISSFTLNLASLLSRNENTFCCLNENNFYVKLIQILKARQPEVAPSTKLGYIKLLEAFLTHKSGIEWIIACNLWEDVLRFSLTSQTVFITKEGRNFMCQILEKVIDYNETVCHNVIRQIMLPLEDNDYNSIKGSDDIMEISDDIIYQNLNSTLQLIGHILDHFLENVLFAKNDCRIVLIFLRDFHLEQKICNLMMIAQNKYFNLDLGKIMFVMQFLELYAAVISKSLKDADIKISIRKMMSIFNMNISKGNFENILKFCYHGQCYWNLMGYKIPCIKTNKDNEPLSFANQLLVIQLLPIFAIAMKFHGKYCEDHSDEFRDQYIQKLFNMMCENTVRIAYTWRDSLIAQPNLFEIATKGLIYIMNSRKYYPRERAAIAFQSFVYALKDVMTDVKNSPEKVNHYAQEQNFFSLLFDAFVVFIEEFQITWRDSVETICVMAISFDFLTVPTWPTKLVVKALKLVNVSITKYMSPNLALLVDRTTDSTMAVLGPLLVTKLHDPSWEVRDTALEVVCTISHMSNTKTQFTSITFPVFTEWITHAVATWNSNGTAPPSRSVVCFTLNLTSLLSKNEERFTCLNNNNFFIKLINVSKARQSDVLPSLKLAYINLLSSFLQHKSGLEWMIACRFWEDIYQFGLIDENCEVVKESEMFMCKLLERTIDHDKEFCFGVIKLIMLPLSESVYKSIKLNPGPVEAPEYLGPTLRLAGNILEYFLEGILFSRNDLRIVLLFWKCSQVEDKVFEFAAIAHSKSFVFEFARFMFIMEFVELYISAIRKSLNPAETIVSVNKLIDRFLQNFYKVDIQTYLKFCVFGHLYWRLIAFKILHFQSEEDNEALKFVTQLTILTLFTQCCMAVKYCYTFPEYEDQLLEDDIRDLFVEKIIKLLSHSVLRVAFYWRDTLIALSNLGDISMEFLHCYKNLKKYFSRSQGVVGFQCLLYTLKDFVNSSREHPEKLKNLVEERCYFSMLFDIFTMFIEEYEITWKESCEAVDVMVLTFDTLTLPVWSDEEVVKILKLLNISISKYMSPNLALLVDRTSDSAIDLLGHLLYSKLHDSGQVKKAALEVVRTLSNMSSSKFPSLQKVLMDSELPTLVVKMSTCDGESFVRATAIKCLQEMIQVEEIWNNALKSENLTQKMREILLNETEGIVRVEAATFMCIAYEQQQFPKDALDSIYETMIHSSTTDLHWEVKVRALAFWDKVIKNHLANQGMIDGSFPNVTFSKEHRKIVTLTDSEIRKRLQKVLGQLSSIGCLGVLMTSIKDDCDMEVSKTAVKITQRLVELFKNYHVYGDSSSAPTSPVPTENGGTSVASVSSGISLDDAMDSPASYHPDFNEEIIDQIVNSKDVCLLKHVYSPSDYGSVTNYDIQVKKIVTPSEFLLYTQQDLNNIITEKKNWLNGIEDLGSLLDDMLKTYDDDINNMDCY